MLPIDEETQWCQAPGNRLSAAEVATALFVLSAISDTFRFTVLPEVDGAVISVIDGDGDVAATLFRIFGQIGVMDFRHGGLGASGEYDDVVRAAGAILLALKEPAVRMAQ